MNALRTLFMALALAACGSAAAGPARVVSVGGAVTEIAVALGAEDRLVAVDTTSVYPEHLKALPQVGYMRSLSAEGVLAMRPDVVLAASEAGPATAIAQLRATGVPVVSLSPEHSVDALRANVRHIADALGMADRGRALDLCIAAQWRATQDALPAAGNRPRVLFVLAHSGNALLVSGAGTAADAMIRLAGGTNALAGVQGYKPLTPEAAVAAAPDVILVTSEGLANVGGPTKLTAQAGLDLTPAGKTNRVVAMDALYLLGFGPRLPAAVRDLASALR
jgi:iron complex transport system substrate-binding protein